MVPQFLYAHSGFVFRQLPKLCARELHKLVRRHARAVRTAVVRLGDECVRLSFERRGATLCSGPPATVWTTDCEKSLRKNCGGSSLARKGLSRIPRHVRRGSLQRNERLEADDQNSAFWNTWVPCGRSAGITSHAVHLVRTVATTGAATTWPS